MRLCFKNQKDGRREQKRLMFLLYIVSTMSVVMLLTDLLRRNNYIYTNLKKASFKKPYICMAAHYQTAFVCRFSSYSGGSEDDNSNATRSPWPLPTHFQACTEMAGSIRADGRHHERKTVHTK